MWRIYFVLTTLLSFLGCVFLVYWFKTKKNIELKHPKDLIILIYYMAIIVISISLYLIEK